MLTFGCHRSPLDWVSNVQNAWSTNFTESVACGWFLNATSPSPVLMTGYDTSNDSEVLLGRVLSLNFGTMDGPAPWNGSIMFKDIADPVFDVIVASSPSGYEGVKMNSTVVAHECNFRWCAKEIQCSMTDGVYHESVLQTYDHKVDKNINPLYMKFTDYDGGKGYVLWDYYGYPKIQSPKSGEVFSVPSNNSAWRMSWGFNGFVKSFTTAENETATPLLRWWNYDTYPPNLSRLGANPWLAPTNITSHMEYIAELMTSVIRSSAFTDGIEMVNGTAWGQQTYVHLRWQWMSMPLILLFLGLLFLVSAILQSHRGEVDIYKTSVLAVLFHGLREDIAVEHNTLQKPNTGAFTFRRDHDDRSKVMVRLRGRKGRWRFSRHGVA